MKLKLNIMTIKASIYFFLIFFISYLFISFILLDFKFSNWEEKWRVFCVIPSLLFLFYKKVKTKFFEG